MELKYQTIILAAGQGTRMKSSLPKVMHKIANQPMLYHVMKQVDDAKISQMTIVTSEDLQNEISQGLQYETTKINYSLQNERLGTAHAVLASKDNWLGDTDSLIVIYADTPLLKTETIKKLKEAQKSADIIVVAFEAANPFGYGRVILDDLHQPIDIIEEKELSKKDKDINLCNSGLMAIKRNCAEDLLNKIDNLNKKGEYYLTDIVKLAKDQGFSTQYVLCDEEDVLGVNDLSELARAEKLIQKRYRLLHLENGVSMADPETVYFSHDTKIEPDTHLEPNIYFGENVEIGKSCTVLSFSHIEGVIIGDNCNIGPFARLRPKTELKGNNKVGNFVEIKNSQIGEGSKVNHLTYIGDSELGKSVNVGAGTITCNYDGFNKNKTKIDDNAFIGSNTSIIAPVNIGKGAIIGSGTVVDVDVDDDSLTLGRVKQENKHGGAKKYREKKNY